MHFYEDVNNFDYIYDSSQLISLSGHKYHGKKNHYNQFINKYNYEIRELDSEKVIIDCIKFAEGWYIKNGDNSELLKYELDGTKDILRNIKLLDFKGMAVYVDGNMVGFTIGERVNKDMAVVHIEKGMIYIFMDY